MSFTRKRGTASVRDRLIPRLGASIGCAGGMPPRPGAASGPGKQARKLLKGPV